MVKKAEIMSNSVRATLFGKFYEQIIRRWFETELGFTIFQGKPRIYWKEQSSLNIFDRRHFISSLYSKQINL